MPARSSSAQPVDELFANPQHPYTVGLLGSIPRLDRRAAHLATIEGMVPNMADPPPGCRFAARCPFVSDICLSCTAAACDAGRRARLAAASGRHWRGWCRDRAARSRRAGKTFRRRAFGIRAGDRACQRPSMASVLPSRPARRWRWSARSGCGKSTVSRLVLRLIEPDAGNGSLRGPRSRRPRCARAARIPPRRARSSSRTPTPRSTRA